MTYYALTVPGVEGLLAREIADGGGRVSERRSGVVFFEWHGDAPTLLRLGLAEDVFALVAREEVSLEKDGLRQIEALVQRVAREQPIAHLVRLARLAARLLEAPHANVRIQG